MTSDGTIFGLAGLVFASLAMGIVLLNGLGIIKGDILVGGIFLMVSAILFSVWALEERVKEIEKELRK